MNNLTEFERQILIASLQGTGAEHLTILVSAPTIVRERSSTRTGRFIEFDVQLQKQDSRLGNLCLQQTWFELEGLDHGGSAILYIIAGQLSMLELVSHQGGWPSEERNFIIHRWEEPIQPPEPSRL